MLACKRRREGRVLETLQGGLGVYTSTEEGNGMDKKLEVGFIIIISGTMIPEAFVLAVAERH